MLDVEWPHGEDQGFIFRDIFFALLFYAQLITIVIISILYGFPAVMDSDYSADIYSDRDYTGIIYLSLVCGSVGFLLSGLSLCFMIRNTERIIEFSLISSVAASFTLVLYGLFVQVAYVAILGILLLILELCYVVAVQPFVPFAASNLMVGLKSVRSNFGIIGFAYFLVGMSFAWVALWYVLKFNSTILTITVF